MLWGPNGIQLTSTTNFVANPKIAGTASGDAVIAWTENSEVKMQKLLPNGATGWGAGVTLTPATGSYSTADLHEAGNDAILSIVHQTGGFTSPKHLRAQKLDGTNGAPLWGATPLAVFDGGSLQFGNFPPFTPDDAGGAVFSWYSSSPSLQCFVQRVDSTGLELFPHNGVAVANTAGQIRVNPSAAYDATGDDVYVFWTEQNGAQSQDGVSGQRIDAAGALQWGAGGATLVPLSTTDVGLVQAVAGGPADGALAFWSEAPAFNQDRLYGSVLERDGTIAQSRFDVALQASGKSRLAVGKSFSTAGFAILAWSDARTDGGDIYVQNVQTDGALGGGADTGFAYCFGDGGASPGCTPCPCGNDAPVGSAGGCLNSSGSSAVLTGRGAPSVSSDTLRFEAANAVPNTFAILFSGSSGLPANIMNPCFGQNTGVISPVLDGLRCAGQSVVRHGTRPTDANGDVGITTNGWGPPNGPIGGLIPDIPLVVGSELYFQCFYRESIVAGCGTGQNTTNGVWVVITN